MRVIKYPEEKMKLSHLIKVGVSKKDKDTCWTCKCGSVNFNIRKDHELECAKCGELTDFIWIHK